MNLVRDVRIKEKFVIDDAYLNGYARLCGIAATGVYMSLCRHASKEQQCFPSKKLMGEELGISEKTVFRALKKLEEWNIVRVENQGRKKDGSFRNNLYTLLDKSVWKSKPKVTRRSPRPVAKEDSPQVIEGIHRRSPRPNKETHIYKETHIKATEVAEPRISELINLFKEVNPSFERLFGNKTQRASTERMLKKYGWEKMESTVKALPQIINRPYAPVITTPYELETKLAKLVAFVKKEEGTKKKINLIKI